jgi:hypothetical protein
MVADRRQARFVARPSRFCAGGHSTAQPFACYGARDVRLSRVAARAVLIAALALVAVPNVVGSRSPSRGSAADDALFERVTAGARGDGAVAAITTPDLAYASEGSMAEGAVLLEPGDLPLSSVRVPIDQPESAVRVVPIWHYERSISFYGPGFYGHRTACRLAYTTSLMGVAHRTLPCGTMVTFRNPYNGISITVPVVDRGPYVYGRTWDLTGAACTALRHCWTGPIYWKYP